MIVARGITVRLGGNLVLSEMNLALPAGGFTAILGPNGAGKSTLLRVLTGELAPSGGSVELDGATLHALPSVALARRRAVLSQHHAVAFGLSVEDVVALGRLPHRGSAEAAQDRAALAGVRTAFGLEALWRRSYPTLSGGERQRVQLARAAAQLWRADGAHHGQALFLDEPAAALDLAQQAAALGFARDIARRGAAVAAVLHDPNHAVRADQVLLLRGGRLLAAGPPAQVLTVEALGACLGVELRAVEGVAGFQLA